MIEKFIEGKWYRWTGPSDWKSNWNDDMDKVKDGKPRQCKKSIGGTNAMLGDGFAWYWGHVLQYFEEVPEPDKYCTPYTPYSHVTICIATCFDWQHPFRRKSVRDVVSARISLE